jgi:catechol 2,3-dioxygenase-like lactoylglutathione lyase family enzyme
MLSKRRAHTALPSSDLDALRPFYEDVLGLTPQAILPGAVFYEVGEGTRFAISRSGIPSAGSHTQMAFTVPDVDAEVAALHAKGIVFEAYESPATDAAGIARIGAGRAAWFKDPAGNLIAVLQLDQPVPDEA